MEHLRARSILITGAAGFVGSHVVRRLIEEGARAHIFVRPESSLWRIDDLLPELGVWIGSLLDRGSLRHCLEGARPEIIFHLAGATNVRWLDQNLSQINRSIDVNLKGTLALLEELHCGEFSVQGFIRTGGLEEYGHGPTPYNEEQREHPVSPYSASQVATTHYCQMLQPHLRFPVVTLRPALIYGPAQSTEFFIPSLITHCLMKQDFDMTSGEQSRDLIYIDDVVEALIRTALTTGIAGEIINIGVGKGYKMRDVAEKILNILDAKIRLKIGTAHKRPSEILELYCHNQKAARLLEWSPKVDLQQGLEQTIAWYQNTHSCT